MSPVRVNGYDFHVVGRNQPYLRIANPSSGDPNGGYIGALEGWAQIRKLRDYLTAMLRQQPRKRAASSSRRGRGGR